MKMVGISSVLVVLLTAPFTIGLESTQNCDAVKAYFEDGGFATDNMPSSQIKSTDLNMCKASHTCCTPLMEDQLTAQSTISFGEQLKRKTTNITVLFRYQHERFDMFFQDLIESAQKSLNTLFLDTYGDLYIMNADVFVKFFNDLKLYYKGGVVDLTDIFDGFFTTLLQRVFRLLNPSYDIDAGYAQCIDDNLNVIRPFADLPQKLSNQVQRSFIAARIFVQALLNGEMVSQRLSQIYPTTTCAEEITKMMHCSKCISSVSLHPCKSVCVETMKNCMCELNSKVDDIWNQYLDAMMQILDRLDGPFDIEATLSPIDVKLSEAVMMLQDNKDDIKDSIFKQCGVLTHKNVSLSIDLSGLANAMSSFKTKRSIDDGLQHGKKHKRSSRKRKGKSREHHIRDVSSSHLNKKRNKKVLKNIRLKNLANDMRSYLKKIKSFWKELPNSMCEAVSEQLPETQCWNGVRILKYGENMTEIDSMKRGCNSEIYVDTTKIPDLATRQQMVVLHEITEKMWQAYRGVDPAFVDQELPTENELESSAEGSGGDWFDVEQNPRRSENKKVKHFSRKKIKLFETALEKKLSRNMEWEELKAILIEHPQLNDDKKQKTDKKFGSLTMSEQKQLKKILGMLFEPNADDDNSDVKNVRQFTTQKTNIISTTSKGRNLKYSFTLTTLLATICWLYKGNGHLP